MHRRHVAGCGSNKWHLPGWFHWHLNNGALGLQRHAEGLSDKQQQVTQDKLLEFIRANPDAVSESDVFRAFEADRELFGDAVFQVDDEEPRG